MAHEVHVIWALLVSLTSSAKNHSLIHYASAAGALFRYLQLAKLVPAAGPLCVPGKPDPQTLQGSLILVIRSDLSSDVTPERTLTSQG